MKIFEKGKTQMYCGYWNGSPLEVGLISTIYEVPKREVLHSHPYREYYVVISGKGILEIDGKEVELISNNVIMVEPHEKHEVTWIDPDEGIRWVIVKEKSEPNGKIIH